MVPSSFLRTRSSALALPSIVALLTGCSGAGSQAPALSVAPLSVARVSGTLQVGIPATEPSASTRFARGTRSPDYVSTGTKHAALFIDGAATAAGSTTSCSPSSCSIAWSATLNVPATHTFAVEVDDAGTHLGVAGTTPYVEAEGSGQYAIAAGSSNSLSALTLNGVAASFGVTAGTCTSSSCSSSVSILDADFYAIKYSGATYTTPGEGKTPTTGQVFDNDGGGANPLIVQADSGTGLVTGTAQSPYSTYGSNQLQILGVNASGTYALTVACASGASGSFGIKVTGASTPSGIVTAAELSGLSPAVSYGVGNSPDGDLTSVYTCTGGQISAQGAASGTLPVN